MVKELDEKIGFFIFAIRVLFSLFFYAVFISYTLLYIAIYFISNEYGSEGYTFVSFTSYFNRMKHDTVYEVYVLIMCMFIC